MQTFSLFYVSLGNGDDLDASVHSHGVFSNQRTAEQQAIDLCRLDHDAEFDEIANAETDQQDQWFAKLDEMAQVPELGWSKDGAEHEFTTQIDAPGYWCITEQTLDEGREPVTILV